MHGDSAITVIPFPLFTCRGTATGISLPGIRVMNELLLFITRPGILCIWTTEFTSRNIGDYHAGKKRTF
jgi:hypothetical protein